MLPTKDEFIKEDQANIAWNIGIDENPIELGTPKLWMERHIDAILAKRRSMEKEANVLDVNLVKVKDIKEKLPEITTTRIRI